MLIFDFNCDIKLAYLMKNIHRHDHDQDLGLLSLHDYFVMLCNEIGWYDLQIRQVSGKFADCAVQFANWQIGPANLQIGQIGRLDGTYTCKIRKIP